ncbi:MAG: hypothetical protein JWO67_5584 [Streptosporangiaceae bacterium]|nr:hypothetical protein [Streptosporangiaceae bacterium]
MSPTCTTAVRNPVISVAAGPVRLLSARRPPSSNQGPCHTAGSNPPATAAVPAATRPQPVNRLSARPVRARRRCACFITAHPTHSWRF